MGPALRVGMSASLASVGLASVALASVGLALAGCGATRSGPAPIPVVVSAPIGTEPWIGGFNVHGAQLSIEAINAAGGVTVGGVRHTLVLDVEDNQGSPQQAVSIARKAVAEHALAIITDGIGAPAVSKITDTANLPVFITYDGGGSLVDAATMPTVFRIAPADKYMGPRLADYIAGQHPKIALITEDSSFGQDGRTAVLGGLRTDQLKVVDDVTVPSEATDLSTQVGQARSRGATLLVLWLHGTGIAAVLSAARAAGWQAPVYAGPDGEDPIVRQLLANHPDWVSGLTFIAGRITSETGPAPFAAFRSAYEKRFGIDRIGVSNVVSPPDYAMYAADAVSLVAAAATSAGALGAPLMAAMGTTVITGANGDERGFTVPDGREGVVPDDMYFARYRGLRFYPVTDDIIGPQHLPYVPQ